MRGVWEPLGADVTTRGTSKSAVSRRFVAQTQAQLDAWRATPLDALDLVGLLIDGVHVGGHCIVVALGIDKMGAKHPLGLWEGATENATVCQGLLTNLGSRGLRTDRRLLVIVDGAKALDTAVTQTFGRAALVQRCQVHKGRNILEHLPEAQRPWVKVVLTRAYTNSHVKTAKRLLQDLARRLDTDYPSAATSVREGLDETLTVLGLGLSERLQRSLATTNAIESLLSRTRHVQRHVKRWRGGTMVLRWVAAGVLEAAKGFPSGARMSRYARAGRCPPGTRRAVRTRGVVRDGCVVVNQAAAEFQQLTGHPLLEAAKAYQEESDPLKPFLADCCELDQKSSAGARELYQAYAAWADQQKLFSGERLSSRAFWTRLGNRFNKRHTRSGEVYEGLCLKREVIRVA